ncbi:hypothetical protein QNH23_06325 [Siminovitchia fortis]|uniref:hypothetical protein n=1 Tax=Siminovitchia fortis TaxID=254758 RepID=UPI0013E2AFAF|nr:hypothetical protein [Siminovitchia fortis]WHY82987.1 hypothetical protein QNH23_06325 [Siminovitchia fortis]
MKQKFKVESYFCDARTLENKMNEQYEKGYYPKQIKVEHYQNSVEGFIIYELEESSC